jgi:hypothetical protein
MVIAELHIKISLYEVNAIARQTIAAAQQVRRRGVAAPDTIL